MPAYTFGQCLVPGALLEYWASECDLVRMAKVRSFVEIECLIPSHCETKLLYSLCGRLDKRGKLYKLGE